MDNDYIDQMCEILNSLLVFVHTPEDFRIWCKVSDELAADA